MNLVFEVIKSCISGSTYYLTLKNYGIYALCCGLAGSMYGCNIVSDKLCGENMNDRFYMLRVHISDRDGICMGFIYGLLFSIFGIVIVPVNLYRRLSTLLGWK